MSSEAYMGTEFWMIQAMAVACPRQAISWSKLWRIVTGHRGGKFEWYFE